MFFYQARLSETPLPRLVKGKVDMQITLAYIECTALFIPFEMWGIFYLVRLSIAPYHTSWRIKMACGAVDKQRASLWLGWVNPPPHPVYIYSLNAGSHIIKLNDILLYFCPHQDILCLDDYWGRIRWQVDTIPNNLLALLALLGCGVFFT